MARTTTLQTYDRLSKGRLIRSLTEWREAGLTYEQIAALVRSEYGVPTTGSTVRRWFLDVIEPEPKGAA